MSSACDPSTWISEYLPDTNTISISTKNIDAVEVNTTIATCDNFTLNGIPYSGLFPAAQNQTATPGITNFAGTIFTDSLNVSSNILSPTSYINNITASTVTTSNVIWDNILTVNGATSTFLVSNPALTSQTLVSTLTPNTNSPSTITWNLGTSSSFNNSCSIVFQNNGLGLSTNYLRISPISTSGLVINTDNVKVETALQIGGNSLLPKTLVDTTPRAIVGGTTVYAFNFSSYSNPKRVILQVCGVQQSTTGAMYVQVGYNGTYCTSSNTTGVYRGTTSGNNAGTSILWTDDRIYLWNQASSTAIQNFTLDFVLEFNFVTNQNGYDIWDVTGAGCSTDNPNIYYINMQGRITMKLSPNLPIFNYIRFGIISGTTTNGYCNVLVFN